MKKSPLKRKTPLKQKRTKLKAKTSLKRTAIKKRKRNIHKKVSRKKASSSPLWRAIKRCDILFSQYIRLLHANKKGEVKCFTCEFVGFWKQSGIENGHYKGRGSMNTRWLKTNCKPQCIRCNKLLSGNLEVFTANLIKEYGPDIIPYLDKESKKKTSLTVEKVTNLGNYFDSQIVILKQKLEI